jgi:hypothetical protein
MDGLPSNSAKKLDESISTVNSKLTDLGKSSQQTRPQKRNTGSSRGLLLFCGGLSRVVEIQTLPIESYAHSKPGFVHRTAQV